MKPSTRITIAGLLSAAGACLSALASEFGAEAPASAESAAAPTPEPPKKVKKEKPAPASEPTAAEPEAPAEPASEETGKTYEELRAIIEPHVKEGKGEEVKKIIAKYSTGGLKTMEAKHHAAFEKDIAALSY